MHAQSCPQSSIHAYREDRTVYSRCIKGFVRLGQTYEPATKRVYHLTAKSWIDGSRITELTWRGKNFHFERNVEPTQPSPNAGDHFKLYKTFVAEVIIAKGPVPRVDRSATAPTDYAV